MLMFQGLTQGWIFVIKSKKKGLIELQTALADISATMHHLLFLMNLHLWFYCTEKKENKLKLLMLAELHSDKKLAVLNRVLSRRTQSSQQCPLTSFMFDCLHSTKPSLIYQFCTSDADLVTEQKPCI